jgi:hypothetical protein
MREKIESGEEEEESRTERRGKEEKICVLV